MRVGIIFLGLSCALFQKNLLAREGSKQTHGAYTTQRQADAVLFRLRRLPLPQWGARGNFYIGCVVS